MSRIPIARSLPSLREVFGRFEGFPPHRSHKDVLLQEIRSVAVRLREMKPRVFYSMRDMADFFHVSISVISAVYGVLEGEGMLDRLHGSRTLLAGKRLKSGRSLRAVVGFPMSLPVLLTSRPGRAIWLLLTEKLNTTGFAVDLIVHGVKEHFQPHFADRVLEHKPDILLWCWPSPHSGCRENIVSLRNHGIRCITVQTAGLSLNLPSLNYLEDCRPAYDQLARSWCRQGVGRVLIPTGPEFRVEAGFRKLLCASLTKAGIEMETFSSSFEALVGWCEKHRNLAVAFLNRYGAEALALSQPLLMARLMQSARVGLCRGSINSSALHLAGARADVVETEIQDIVAEILSDIPSLLSLGDITKKTFVSHFREREGIQPYCDVDETVLPAGSRPRRRRRI